MITEPVWDGYWMMLCERFNKTFSSFTTDEYLLFFSDRLDDEGFIAACRKAFQTDKFFPTPQRLLELGAMSKPVQAFTAAAAEPETPAYTDLNDFEKAQYRRSIQASRELVKSAIAAAPTASGFTSLGAALSTNDLAIAAQKRQAKLDQMNDWLIGSDKAFAAEAESWGEHAADVVVIRDDQNKAIALQWKHPSGEAIA